MLNKFNLKKSTFVLAILFILSFSLILFCVNDTKEFNHKDSSNFDYTINPPKLQLFDYKPVLSEKLHDLGNISIINMDPHDQGFLYRNGDYESIKNDLASGNLIADFSHFSFSNTLRPARFNNSDIRDRFEYITVKFNIYITFYYNSSASGLLMYQTNLYPTNLLDVNLNGTLLPEGNYTIDSENAFIYNYREQHIDKNGTLPFIFTYDYRLNIEYWNINQDPNQNFNMINKTQTQSVNFTYGFTIKGLIKTSQGSIGLADNLDLDFLFCIEDSNKLYNFEYLIGNESKDINAHKNPQNWFNGSCLANQTLVLLKFTTNFIIGFNNVCYDFWAIDRLIMSDNIRERIYFLEIFDGPSGIYLEGIQFIESNVYYSQFRKITTNFERGASVIDLNTTEGGGLSPKPGLNITSSYFIKNEVLAVIVEYQTTEFLSVVVTDHIKVPLTGVILRFYYFNQTYGTYISSEKSQPIPYRITDDAGQVVLYNVPIGIYTVEIYNPLGHFEMNGTADTSIAPNYINTTVIHFPTWIIIFSIIYSIILLAGVWIYIKNKNL